jgi:hypothetical protein
MEASEAPLVGTILRWVDDFPSFAYYFASELLIPWFLGLWALGTMATILYRFWRTIVPPSLAHRYQTAKQLYRRGKREQALHHWAELKDFGPAYLSLATHALYVEHDSMKALGIIRQAKERKVRININQVNMIRMDAKALQIGGNATMVDMNATMAKQDHLGTRNV